MHCRWQMPGLTLSSEDYETVLTSIRQIADAVDLLRATLDRTRVAVIPAAQAKADPPRPWNLRRSAGSSTPWTATCTSWERQQPRTRVNLKRSWRFAGVVGCTSRNQRKKLKLLAPALNRGKFLAHVIGR